MFDIYLQEPNIDHPQKIRYDYFKKNFLDICQQNKETNRALAFAFIIYDLNNPEILEVLNKKVYWNALNTISGRFLTIYSINTKNIPGLKTFYEVCKPTKKALKNHFADDEYIFPSILFFQVKENKVSDSFFVKLKTDRIEDSFIEIKKYIEAATNALKGISEENYKNHDEIFVQLKKNVKSIESLNTFKELWKGAKPIHDFISILFTMS